jgi:hypothetical protein
MLMAKRMRVLGWQVMPVIVIDDGDSLEQQPVQAQIVSLKEWKAFKDGGDEAALASLRSQIEELLWRHCRPSEAVLMPGALRSTAS